jgi:hypothetical protein
MPTAVLLGLNAIPCKDAYEANVKKAGIYARADAWTNTWTYRP